MYMYTHVAVDVISLSLVCCYRFIRFRFVEFVSATAMVVRVSCDDTQLTTIFYRTVGVFVLCVYPHYPLA